MKNVSDQNSRSERLKILVCTAGPEPAGRMKTELARIADYFEVDITVLKVLPHGSPIPADELQDRGEKATGIIVDSLQEQGIEASSHLRFSDSTAKGIVETAEDLKVDLVIVGVGDKPSWLRNFIKGDVTERVFHEAPCPVVALPQDIKRSPFAEETK